jgi:hypothetical protein
MGETYLYPQLDHAASKRKLRTQADLSLDDLERQGEITHPDAAPAATGGHPVPADRLLELQAGVRRIAREAGYPAPLPRGATQSFDRPAGAFLYRTMEIVPADAAEEGVWSFLSLVVVPEIGPWRFPGRSEERLLGRPRNVFRRVWWRAWAFGADLDSAPPGCTPLGEDEFVQVMERPSLGGNRRTARAIRDSLWRSEGGGLTVPRSELMREISRRIRAERSHRALDVLDDSQLAQLLDHLAEVSIVNLESSVKTPQT